MAKQQNLPVSLKIVDQFLNSFEQDPAAQAKAAKAMIAELKQQRKALADGYNRKELTVCVGKIGFVEPNDVNRLIRGEIPRLTVYHKKKSNHHMPLYYKNVPAFYKENASCKTVKSSTTKRSSAKSKNQRQRTASSRA